MKKLLFTLTALILVSISHVGGASYEEDGPYLEMEETAAANFFMLDVEDMEIPLAGVLPSLLPCDGIVTSGFGWRRLGRRARRGRLHKGMDIAAPYGTPIVAAAPGKVIFVGRKGGYGHTVIVDHGGELSTLYAHNSQIFVKEGDYVTKGQEISPLGSTGHSTGPHLHYEVRVEGVPVNPERFF